MPEDLLSDSDMVKKADRLGLGSGRVNIVRGWAEGPVPEGREPVDSYGGGIGDAEDWMRIRAIMVAPSFYVELDSPEAWWPH